MKYSFQNPSSQDKLPGENKADFLFRKMGQIFFMKTCDGFHCFRIDTLFQDAQKSW